MITLKEACKIGEKECGAPIVKIIETNTCWIFKDAKRVNHGQIVISPMVEKATGELVKDFSDPDKLYDGWKEIPVPTDY